MPLSKADRVLLVGQANRDIIAARRKLNNAIQPAERSAHRGHTSDVELMRCIMLVEWLHDMLNNLYNQIDGER